MPMEDAADKPMPKKTLISCNTCKLWQVKDGGQDGICRRLPPRPEIMPKGQEVVVVWPSTTPSDWCGEWRPMQQPEPQPAAKS